MIDTDKYEGHTPAPWLWYEDEEPYTSLDLVVADDQCRTVIEEVKALNTKADAQLIADAPLLLEAYKELRKRNEWLEEVLAQAQEHYHIDLSDEGWPRWREEE